jgi:adenylate cyclase
MAKEIERKFLVDRDSLGSLVNGMEITQAYISTRGFNTVRARIAGNRAWLTLKGKTEAATRSEFEYEIPLQDARQIIAEMCDARVISKTRYHRNYAGHLWEIDVFGGENAGLLVAEVELTREDEELQLPDWVAEEVTLDPRYYNVNLLSHPFSDWSGD